MKSPWCVFSDDSALGNRWCVKVASSRDGNLTAQGKSEGPVMMMSSVAVAEATATTTDSSHKGCACLQVDRETQMRATVFPFSYSAAAKCKRRILVEFKPGNVVILNDLHTVIGIFSFFFPKKIIHLSSGLD